MQYLNANTDKNLYSVFAWGICASISKLHVIGRWAPGGLKIGDIWYFLFVINASYGALEFCWVDVAKFTLTINLDMRPP